jgi:hypothetical protein
MSSNLPPGVEWLACLLLAERMLADGTDAVALCESLNTAGCSHPVRDSLHCTQEAMMAAVG